MPNHESVIIRRMSVSDIPIALSLIHENKWNQTEQDWLRFLEMEPEGCFVARRSGALVATITSKRFASVGWLGMLIVAPTERGTGIGRAMMSQGIRYLLSKGVRTIKLDATPMGRPLYERMGFTAEYNLQRFTGTATALDYTGITPLAGNLRLLQEMACLDRRAYGINRLSMLSRLVSNWPELAAVHSDGNEIDGYIAGRHGHSSEHLGPIVALNPIAAEQLIRWGFTQTVGKQIIMDRPAPNLHACRLVEQYGLKPLREFTRMHLGQEPYADNPDYIFASSGAEKG